jgi:hypothetical protein
LQSSVAGVVVKIILLSLEIKGEQKRALHLWVYKSGWEEYTRA